MKTLAALLALLAVPSPEPSRAVPNWSAPPYWRRPAPSAGGREAHRDAAGAPEASTSPLVLIGIDPCRVVDTRGTAGVPYNTGGKLAPGESRTYDLSSAPAPCDGIPADARAFSLNLTATEPEAPGFLSVFPSGPAPIPLTSILNFDTGESVANATVVPSDGTGSITVLASTAVHVIVDVNGYYAPLSSQAGSVVTSLAGGTGDLTLSGSNGITASLVAQAVTVGSNATPNGVASTIVSRDAAGSFAAQSLGLSGVLSLPATGAAGTAGALWVGGQSFLHAFGTGSTFLGAAAGSFAATGTDNTAVGAGALGAVSTASSGAAFGRYALASVTTGGNNSAFGWSALRLNVTGVNSSAFGHAALGSSTVSDNDAFGYFALKSNTTGTHNSAFGGGTLNGNTVGSDNAGFGFRTLASNVDGSNNTALGSNALWSNTSGDNNTAGGSYALNANATGSGNTALGADALRASTGSTNTGVGYRALTANTTGSRHTAVGSSALAAETTGYSNTGVGVLSLGQTTVGDRNTAIGDGSLFRNTSGVLNAAIGFNSLESVTTGSYNVGLGFDAGALNATGSNNVYVAALAAGNESNTIRIGTVTANTSYPTPHGSAYLAGVYGQTSSSGVAVFVNSSGKLGTTTSSRRFKEEIADVRPDESGLVLRLRPVSFLYRREVDDGSRRRQYGLVAEEVAEIAPDLVAFDPDGQASTVRYHLLVPLLLARVQEQERTIEELRGRLSRLAERLDALEGR